MLASDLTVEVVSPFGFESSSGEDNELVTGSNTDENSLFVSS